MFPNLHHTLRGLHADADAARQVLIALPDKIAAAIAADRQHALVGVRATIGTYGFTAEELYSSSSPVPPPPTEPPAPAVVVIPKQGEPKYRNPETGDTWTGRGKCPSWLVGKHRTDYLIVKVVSDASAGVAPVRPVMLAEASTAVEAAAGEAAKASEISEVMLAKGISTEAMPEKAAGRSSAPAPDGASSHLDAPDGVVSGLVPGVPETDAVGLSASGVRATASPSDIPFLVAEVLPRGVFEGPRNQSRES